MPRAETTLETNAMKTLVLAGAAILAAALATSNLATGHGGTYRGPGDTVPPGGGRGAGGPPSPPSQGPPAQGPHGAPQRPPTPGSPGGIPGAPGGGSRAAVTGQSSAGVDLTDWEFWWGFNKDPYLQLKAAIHMLGPATNSDNFFLGRGQQDPRADRLSPNAEDRARVKEALLVALEREGDSSNDVLTGALIALAKIGEEVDVDGNPRLAPVFQRFLSHPNNEVAECAALAMGILASESCIDPLTDLLTDSPAGRRAVKGTEVPYPMRAAAAFGLGLIGSRINDEEQRQRISFDLVRLMESPAFSTRDIKVACMSAFGIVPLAPSGPIAEGVDITDPAQATSSYEAQVAYLLRWLDPRKARQDMRTHHWYVRAHAPTALARLVADHPEREAVLPALTALLDEHADVHDFVRMSVAQALGSLVDADGEGPDAQAREALVGASKTADQQTRRFALIALAQAGSRKGQGEDAWGGAADVQRALQRPLGKGRLRPWSALAIGVHVNALLQADGPGVADLQRALRAEASGERSPADAGAFMIGVGLAQDQDAYEVLSQRLDFFNGRPQARGYAAVGLGLLGNTDAKEALQDLLASSRYKPELLRSCAVGLGLLRDKSLVPNLTKELARAKTSITQAALAGALGTIGDRSAIDPLLEMLADPQVTQTARGFAAVSLGMVCDERLLPWSVPYSVGFNYRASTPSMTGSGTGLLQIL